MALQLTSEISSNDVRDDPSWPDSLCPGCGCPAYSGRGVHIHVRLVFLLPPLWSPCEGGVLPAICKTEWQHCLNLPGSTCSPKATPSITGSTTKQVNKLIWARSHIQAYLWSLQEFTIGILYRLTLPVLRTKSRKGQVCEGKLLQVTSDLADGNIWI